MPGKVNPVIPEVVNQVAFERDRRRMRPSAAAAEGGQLQLNAFEPVDRAQHPASAIAWMTNACNTLGGELRRRHRGQPGPAAAQVVDASVGVVTALTPYIGYCGGGAPAAHGAHHARVDRRSGARGGPDGRTPRSSASSPERLSGWCRRPAPSSSRPTSGSPVE